MDELSRCKGWIEAALDYSGGTHTFEDIAAGIASGVMQLWPAPDGCLVTEIVVYPRKKVLNVFLGGGNLERLTDMHDDVAAWGVMQGCSAATINGRRGWERVYRKRGWHPLHLTLVKELT
jgi:hypothetical protein